MIVTLDEAKQYLDVSGNEQDVALQQLIDRLADTIESELGWYFGAPRQTTEIIGGLGIDTIWLRQPPVVDDDHPLIIETRTFGYPYDTVDASEYEVDGRKIIRTQCWPVGERTIRVTYWEGYNSAPGDVKQLLLEFIQGNTSSSAGGGSITSERLGDYSYSVANVSADSVRQSQGWMAIKNRYSRALI